MTVRMMTETIDEQMLYAIHKKRRLQLIHAERQLQKVTRTLMDLDTSDFKSAYASDVAADLKVEIHSVVKSLMVVYQAVSLLEKNLNDVSIRAVRVVKAEMKCQK